MTRKAESLYKVFDPPNPYQDGAHALVSWKDTRGDVTFVCSCRKEVEAEKDAPWWFQCPACKKMFYAMPFVELIEIEKAP